MRDWSAAIATWALAIVLAALAGLAAFGNVLASRSSPLALGIWPTNGFAPARIGYAAMRRDLVRQGSGAQEFAVDERTVMLARRSIAQEPTSALAIALVALGAAGNGEDERARALMTQALALSRRVPLATSWVVQDAARRGDNEAVFRNIERLARTRPETQDAFVPVFASTLADPANIAILQPILARHPAWEPAFWLAARQSPAALRNAATLRYRLARTVPSARASTSDDPMLIAALANAGNLDEAARLADIIAPRTPRDAPAGDVLGNGGFARPAGLPFGNWETLSSAQLGGSIDARRGTLDISALSGASGIVARQYVRPFPGRYTLEAVQGQGSTSGSARIDVTMRCVRGPGPATLVALTTPERAPPALLTVPGDGCGWYVVTIGLQAGDDSRPIDGVVDAVRLIHR